MLFFSYYLGDFVSSKFVAKLGKGKYVEKSSDQNEYDAPDNESRFNLQRKTEQGDSQVRKNAGFANERQRSHRLLHRNLSH